MAQDVKVPTLGESVTEATIGRWLKKAGDAVKLDEPIVELETDKVAMEVNAPAAGVLTEIVAKEGETVGIGALIARIDLAVNVAGAAPSAGTAPAAVKTEVVSAPAAAAAAPLSPVVRKALAEQGLDAASVKGTGKKGRVMKEDVEAAAKFIVEPSAAAPATTPPSLAAAPSAQREERVPMTRLRKRIAERLKMAQNTAAMLTTYNEVDMTAVMAARKQYVDLFEKKHGVRLGFMSFFVKACVLALREIPAVNAEIDGEDIVYKHYVNMGVAVSAPAGLVVPVIRDAQDLSFAETEKAIADFGRRARDGKLALDELQGGSFTISNGGVFGSLMSSPIINPPQSAILGMHKIQERPVALGGQVVIRPMMYLALSYDHRIIDGREAVTFLVRVKECLEDPQRLLLDL